MGLYRDEAMFEPLQVAWDDENEWWTFDGGPFDGRPLPCVLLARQSPPPGECLEHARRLVLWLRANERQLRRSVAARMVEYLEREFFREPGKDIDVAPEKVEPNIRIAEVTFIETKPARVDYASLGPLARLDWRWKGGISVEVDGAGGVVRGPEFSASWAPERLVWPG
jgi:hypothetical protein